jgi:hypothetical protein
MCPYPGVEASLARKVRFNFGGDGFRRKGHGRKGEGVSVLEPEITLNQEDKHNVTTSCRH